MSELFRSTANEIHARLKSGEISPLDCLDALEARIAAVDSKVNALPTLCFDRARAHARELMKKPMAERGVLLGLPVPIKDLSDVAGVRSTQGSPIFADRIAPTSDVMVTHLERNGAIVYAMSNTPEFGAGANTFNEVFGRTLNPWNTSRSAAGSSGGAAVALGHRHRMAGPGLRSRRILAKPRQLLRRRRHAAIARPRGRQRVQQDRFNPRHRRPHGPQCRRPGACSSMPWWAKSRPIPSRSPRMAPHT